MKRYAVIVAGGSGTRMGAAVPKQFLPLAGRPVLMHTLERFEEAGCDEIVLVLPGDQLKYWDELSSLHKFKIKHKVVEGGDERSHSVQNGLTALPEEGLVAIHDGVRPCIDPELIRRCFETAAAHSSAVPVVKPKDSIRVLNEGSTIAVNRNDYFLVQTPQVFDLTLLRDAYRSADGLFTDDASVFEASGHRIALVDGSYTNIKVTTPDDLILAGVFITQKK